MQLMIVGTLDGQIGAASSIAIQRGAKVVQANDADKALELLRNGQGADLLMVDVKQDIRKLIDALEIERIAVPVVACGIDNDTRAAVDAIKAGAKEYVPLPPDPDMIAAILSAATEETHTIIFKDPIMGQVVKMAEQVAPSEASIMITGESGTGKEVFARFLHAKSKRADKRFVAINCAAIPENLLESELFGHEKGAFTGAVARRLGKFEEADGGTLLLDEVSEMDVRLQAKLLRVLQEKEIDRLGGKKTVKVNVRIIATSNRNLEEAVKAGTFREDLYFRLNVMNLRLPALRERPLDIPILTHHFIGKYSEANEVAVKPLSAEARKMLMAHHWQGNVRELENTLHRAVLLSTGSEIGPDAIILTGSEGASSPSPEATAALAAQSVGGDRGSPLVGRTVADVERDLIIDTLKHCLGNRTHAANILGISIRTLRNKLKLYTEEGFSVPTPGAPDAERAPV